MSVRKLAMCVVVLFAITMGVPVIAGDASMDVRGFVSLCRG